jgi:hypothetical protein
VVLGLLIDVEVAVGRLTGHFSCSLLPFGEVLELLVPEHDAL